MYWDSVEVGRVDVGYDGIVEEVNMVLVVVALTKERGVSA